MTSLGQTGRATPLSVVVPFSSILSKQRLPLGKPEAEEGSAWEGFGSNSAVADPGRAFWIEVTCQSAMSEMLRIILDSMNVIHQSRGGNFQTLSTAEAEQQKR